MSKCTSFIFLLLCLSGCEVHYKSTSSSDIAGDTSSTNTTTDSSTTTDDNSEDTLDVDVTSGDSSPVDVEGS